MESRTLAWKIPWTEEPGHHGVSITSGLEPGVIFSYNFIYSLDGPQCKPLTVLSLCN